MRGWHVLFFCLLTTGMMAQQPSALNKRDFDKYWKVESEAPDYKLSFLGDTADIVAPKGLTMWRKQKMSGKVRVEYDACVVMETETDRLSDLNTFWMAQDPKNTDDIFARAKWRQGIFTRCYSLRMYYLGYGGNHNTTTRFRRYDGDEKGIDEQAFRPAILTEYTDPAHLLKPNHWYHITITNDRNRVCYYMDGEKIVDFEDAEPLTEGWFGFRTTLSHVRITGFRMSCEPLLKSEVPLHWIGEGLPEGSQAVRFGVPFDEGELQQDCPVGIFDGTGRELDTDYWPLAFWQDGSVKWLGCAAVVPAEGNDNLVLRKKSLKAKRRKMNAIGMATDLGDQWRVQTGVVTAYIPKSGEYLVDSLLRNGIKVGERIHLVAASQNATLTEQVERIDYSHFKSRLKTVEVERNGNVSTVVRLEGEHSDGQRSWLPFTIRLYFFAGSPEVRLVHCFVFDGDEKSDFIGALGVRMEVPFRDEFYNRHVAFACPDGGVWSEPVQPLDGRRDIYVGERQNRKTRPDESLPDEQAEKQLTLQQQQMLGMRIPPYDEFNKQNRTLLDEWAAWNDYRLSQPTPDGFTIRKRANDNNPWIGTFSGTRSPGVAFVGDVTGGMAVYMKDFWQSCPSSLEVSGCRGGTAVVTAWLWSPDAEPMDLRHYDNVAHGLNSAYEDVQEGMSTPYGIARTSTICLTAETGYKGKTWFAEMTRRMTDQRPLLPTVGYLHEKRAFGIWSLPDRTTPLRSRIEDRLDFFIDYYKGQIEQHRWYGFWNYGDVMHAYDAERHEWRYDVGGFAWDNTELAPNMWLWYSFLRTGREDVWRMAEAMTRHTSEVDVYHLGPNAMLGTRHNVSHWGCGAKEARISQAAWNRFYYYLTADERCGDLMEAVTDADQMLYHLDPMRLAQPRGQFPCTAPARLRIGPDWLAYAGNWMTHYERTQDTKYRDKIIAGMKSIAALPNRLFTGPKALGYDPATGVITTECDPNLLSTNHLMTIMGGFEIMNEMMRSIDVPEWREAWLDHAARYKKMAATVSNNTFRISRLLAYAAYHLRDKGMAQEAWDDLTKAMGRADDVRFQPVRLTPPEVPAEQQEVLMISTNGVATWALDAIYMMEVIPPLP